MVLTYKTTKDLPISKLMVDQVIGQEHAVKIIKKAALKRRNVLLIGSPGTGKSLIGQALAELLPKEKLIDVLSYPNFTDENVPLIKTQQKGIGRETVNKAKFEAMGSFKNQNIILLIIVIIASAIPYFLYSYKIFPFDSPVIYAASMLTSMVFIIGFIIFLNLNKRSIKMGSPMIIPKLLIDNAEVKTSPFHDATGAHAGALLGDVLHDPLQSFVPKQKLQKIENVGLQIQIKNEYLEIVDTLLEKNKFNLIKQGSYEATFLEKGELNILAEKENQITEAEVLSVNKYYKEGEIIKLTTESGKELLVTPEHKVAIKTIFNKIKYIPAEAIKPWHTLVTID